MQDNNIYRIPKNLNSEFALLSFYAQNDAILLIGLFMAGIFGAVVLKLPPAMLPCVFAAILRFRYNGYTLFFWSKTAVSFLLARRLHTNEYILFERWRNTDGNDESAEL